MAASVMHILKTQAGDKCQVFCPVTRFCSVSTFLTMNFMINFDLLLRKKSLKWRIILLSIMIFGSMFVAGFAYFTYQSYWLNVDTALKGLMNFTDAKQQGVIRFLDQNHKLAIQLANLADHADTSTLRNQFKNIVATDVFRVDQHPFKDEIVAGTRKIPTWRVYHAIDYVRHGIIIVSSDQKREGQTWNKLSAPLYGYSDPYYDKKLPVLTFSSQAGDGTVYVHVDARMLTEIVNGEIGNLAGGMGAFYLAGVGKTLDYYIVNKQNLLITESRVRAGLFLKGSGSLSPWQATTRQAGVMCGKNGKYTTNAKCTTGCREAMGFYPGIAGKEMLGASMPFYDSGWTIVVEEEAGELLKPMWVMLVNVSIVLLGIGILACFMFLRLLDKSFFFPLKRLQDSIEAVEVSQNFDSLIKTETEGEIAELGSSYNRMLEKMCALYNSLENRIVERTHDLTLANEQLRIAAAAFETHEGILITDVNCNIIRVNQAFQAITGYCESDVIGKTPHILSSGRHGKEFYDEMWQKMLSSGSWTGEIWNRLKNGDVHPLWVTNTVVRDKSGKITEYVSVFSDITARKNAEEEIRKLAFSDTLTKLPNRRLLKDRLGSALAASARSSQYGAVLFLDMDKFKTLNDIQGHDFGDLLLVEVAARIRHSLREMDTVARLGGDEFVVIVENQGETLIESSNKVALIADKIRTSLAMPYQLRHLEHHCSVSIGVSLFHGHEQSPNILLKQADLAMYQAKDAGRNAVRFYDPDMQQMVEKRASLETDLRHAVSDQQLRLYYQIQIDGNHRPIGAEALVRWLHPVQGMISPAKFIPIAEESSLILEVGTWVMNTACRQLSMWAKSEKTCQLVLAVNVSAHQFRQADFVAQVESILSAHNINASRLKVELTESVALDSIEEVIAKMYALKALGVRISMDDFGTGYSSLSYLKKLPLDQIKIDQSFVRDITTDPMDAMMVKSIIDMAQNFGLNVIAEGVETADQLEFLKQNGCMAYQGYLFSKPVAIEAFEALLATLT